MPARAKSWAVRWPWKRRPNPPIDALDLRPVWLPLRRDGRFNASIRDAVRGAAGVYAIRERGSRTVLYVGESHAAPDGAKGYESTRRMWQTLKRHFFPWSVGSEWIHKGSGDLDVALWITAPEDARTVEETLIADLEPVHASGHFIPEDVVGVPF